MKVRKIKLEEKTIKNVRSLRKKSTPQERIVWARLKNRQFNNFKFRRQYLIGKYIVDFVCLEKKLIIELDGWQHKEKNHRSYDLERTRFLIEKGYKIVRFWNNDVNSNLAGVFLKIEEFL